MSGPSFAVILNGMLILIVKSPQTYLKARKIVNYMRQTIFLQLPVVPLLLLPCIQVEVLLSTEYSQFALVIRGLTLFIFT